MSHTCHRNISRAIINPNSLEQGTPRDFVNSGPSSATVQGLKGPTNIKTRLEISTELRTYLTAFPHSPSLELLKCCRLESLEKSIQNFGVFYSKAADIPSLSIPIPHAAHGEGVWNPLVWLPLHQHHGAIPPVGETHR